MPVLSKFSENGSDRSVAALLQDAAFDPSRWPAALASLSDSVCGAGAVLFSTNERLALQHSPNMARSLETYRADHWDVRDERYRALPTMLRNGIATEADFTNTDEINRLPYYRDFLERFGLRWFAGLGFSLNGSIYCVAVQRRIEQNPFEPEEIRRLERMLVPIHDSITIAQKLGVIQTKGLLQTLEQVAQPALVCDLRGGVVAMNQSGERIFAPLIDPMSRQLRPRDFRSQRNLNALMKSAILSEGRRPCDAVATIRDAQGFPHQVRAVTFGDWISAFHSNARVLLLLPPETAPPDVRATLCDKFGLTQAEAKLAHDLAKGQSLVTVAEKLNITYETARSRLKVVFRKTGVHRQAELVALIARPS